MQTATVTARSSVSNGPTTVASPPKAEVTDADRREALRLPMTTRFELGDRITPVQQAFLDEHGFILFGGVARPDEVQRVFLEIDRIQERWLSEGREAVRGIPLFIGRDPDGKPFIQRFAFTSCFSDWMRAFVRDRRFAPVRSLIGENTRVGDEEKDGLVFNRNVNVQGSAYKRLGWHTDGLRALAYGRMPGPMLNVGMHFDRIRREDGGLRIIPGSHKQGFASMLLGKPYFVSHRPDPREIAIETEPGDLTVHDGRTWHRVERHPQLGWPSLRRTMYVPYLTDEYSPKSEDSKTPFYHHLGSAARKLNLKLFQRQATPSPA